MLRDGAILGVEGSDSSIDIELVPKGASSSLGGAVVKMINNNQATQAWIPALYFGSPTNAVSFGPTTPMAIVWDNYANSEGINTPYSAAIRGRSGAIEFATGTVLATIARISPTVSSGASLEVGVVEAFTDKLLLWSKGNSDIEISPNGIGNVLVGNYKFDGDQTVGAGQDNYVLTYDNATGLVTLEPTGIATAWNPANSLDLNVGVRITFDADATDNDYIVGDGNNIDIYAGGTSSITLGAVTNTVNKATTFSDYVTIGLNGGIRYSPKSDQTTQTMSATDSFYGVNTSSAAQTMTTNVSAASGHQYWIFDDSFNAATFNVTIALAVGHSWEQGYTTVKINQNGGWIVISPLEPGSYSILAGAGYIIDGTTQVGHPGAQYLGTLYDINGNELLVGAATASAVNYVGITNAATTGSPIISSVGSDSNVNLTLNSQGTGSAVKATVNGVEIFKIGYGTVYSRKIIPNSSSEDLGADTARWVSLYLDAFADLQETTEPTTPGAAELRVYAYDNAGTQELRAKFDTGTVGTLMTDAGSLAVSQSAYVYLDGDRDTYIHSSGDDLYQLYVGATRTVASTSSSFAIKVDGQVEGVFQILGRWVVYPNALITGAGTIPYTLGSDESSIPVDSTGGAYSLVLPPAAAGYTYWIYDATGTAAGANVTIAPNTGDAIGGAATSLKITSNYGAVQLHCYDATTWIIIGGQGYTAT